MISGSEWSYCRRGIRLLYYTIDYLVMEGREISD